MKKFIIFISLCITFSLHAKDPEDLEEEAEQVTIGNFAVRGANQPGSLFVTGGTVIGEGILQTFVYSTFLSACNQAMHEIFPTAIYGLTDHSALLLSIPFAAKLAVDNLESSGLQDIYIQYEHLVFYKGEKTYSKSIALVAGMNFPTGSENKLPPTTLGGPSFVLAANTSYLAYDWLGSLASGTLLTTPFISCGTKIKYGNVFFVESAFGRNIWYRPGWTLTFLVEATYGYFQRDLIAGIKNPDSGGNVFALGPSFWLASDHLVVQGGVLFPIYQRWFGNQPLDNYLIAAALTWTF